MSNRNFQNTWLANAGLCLALFFLSGVLEYLWRTASIQANLKAVAQRENKTAQREAVKALSQGCASSKPYNALPEYVRDRLLGNCRYLGGQNLDGAELSNLNLEGVNFSGCFSCSTSSHLNNSEGSGNVIESTVDEIDPSWLSVSLQRANLRQAILTSADLTGVNLQSANLQQAHLDKAEIWGADLRHANLRRASLQAASLSGSDLGFANLSFTNLQNANLVNTNLQGADLRNANLEGAMFGCDPYSTAQKCTDLKGIQWNEQTNWHGIQWEGVKNIPPSLKQQLDLP